MPSQTNMPEETLDDQFVAARALLNEILRVPEFQEFFDLDDRPSIQMVYERSATIWLLILQRLRGGASLSSVVSETVDDQTGISPENKSVREGTPSENTGTVSRARKRLLHTAIEEFSHKVCDYLGRTAEPAFDDRRVFIIDGTTITLPPTPYLRKKFPPATNQRGKSVCPTALLTVAAELQSGCILVPKIDPKYGPNNSSAAKQTHQIVTELPKNSIVLADSNFGIFSAAHHTTQAGHDFLFRTTLSRFRAYCKKAQLVDQGEGYKSYRLQWTPTTKECQNNLDIPQDTSLEVFIHELQDPSGTTLPLITSLPFDANCLAELYRRRYDLEFDIRDVKVTMDVKNIQAKSLDTFRKEYMGSIVAFNLVSQVRRSAAKLANVPPGRLSFSGVWLSFTTHLLRARCETAEKWRFAFSRMLVSASKRKLSVRKKPKDQPPTAHTDR